MARITVIMGVYNSEKTLKRAVDSILAQTFTDWVFVICDDGSTDSSFQYLREYKVQYPDKFIILKNDRNRGLTYTLNHCLSHVASEYVARMDSDDVSLPMRFEREVEFLDIHPEYGFVGCGIERFDENGVWMCNKGKMEVRPKDFYHSSCFAHPTVMMRKAVLDKVGGYKEVWYTNRCEDYDLWMRLYANGYKGYNLEECLFQYYEGKDSFPKRKYKYRVGEAVMRAKGYALVGLYPIGIIYVCKPLIAGLLPRWLVRKLHKK